MSARSRGLAAMFTAELGGRRTVRLYQSGMLGLFDHQRRLINWYSWETDEPDDSPANLRHVAGILSTERMLENAA
jgi:hypothetical protein